MKKSIIKLTRNKWIASIVLLVLGILMLVAPGGVLDTYIRVFGIILLAGAVIGAVVFLTDKSENKSVLILVEAVAVAVFGAAFIIIPGKIASVLPFIFGVILILNSVTDMCSSFYLPFGRLVSFLMALAGLGLGVLIVFNPHALANFITRIIGITMIFDSVVGIVAMILNKRGPAEPEVIIDVPVQDDQSDTDTETGTDEQ